jgi:hypothetical protein
MPTAYEQHDPQFSTAIVTGAGLDTESLTLRVVPSATLSGVVLDEAGEPIRHANVTLFRENFWGGFGRIRQMRQDESDDRGGFEFGPINAGTYFVMASAKPWYAVHPASTKAGDPPTVVDPSVDVVYAPTYYGDTTASDDATPIPVRGGDRIQTEIHLTPVQALRVVFRTPTDGSGFNMPMLMQRAFDGSAPVQNEGIREVSPGLAEMVGVPPGRYSIQMAGSGAGEAVTSEEVDLTSSGEELRTSGSQAASSVKITAQLMGGGALPPQLQIGLRTAKGRFAGFTATTEKGEAEFHDVHPGTYEVLATTETKRYFVAEMNSPGDKSTGHSLVLEPGSSSAVTISLVGGEVTIEGVATRASKPVPGAMIVLIPKDPEQHHELFRRDQSDLDGTFTLREVIPGTYTVIAIEDGWDLEWASPAVVEHYSHNALTVVVKEQSSGTMRLPDSVAVQTK